MLQVHGFLGLADAGTSAGALMSFSKSIRKVASQRQVSQRQMSERRASVVVDSSSPSRSPAKSFAEGKPWKPYRVERVARKICFELQFSMAPFHLRRLISASRDSNPERLAVLFCLSAWVNAWIPDSAEIGSYSNSVTSKVYKKAAEQMPRLLLVSAFGHEDVSQNVKYFLEQLEHAENQLSNEELAVVENIVAKDRGPFLYWMVNECQSQPVSRDRDSTMQPPHLPLYHRNALAWQIAMVSLHVCALRWASLTGAPHRPSATISQPCWSSCRPAIPIASYRSSSFRSTLDSTTHSHVTSRMPVPSLPSRTPGSAPPAAWLLPGTFYNAGG